MLHLHPPDRRFDRINREDFFMSNNLKGMSVALGIGLAILWIAGLSSPYAPGWLTWLDGIAALCAFTIAASSQIYETRGRRMGGPIALSVALFGIAIVALGSGAVAWLSWWTFAFACAFLVLGVAAGGTPDVIDTTDINTTRDELERLRLEREKRDEDQRRVG
jgi:hypothetical protein